MEDKIWKARQFIKNGLETLSGDELSSFRDLYGIVTVDRERMMLMDMMEPGCHVAFRDWSDRSLYNVVPRHVLMKMVVLGGE